jgi:hypothetical protein
MIIKSLSRKATGTLKINGKRMSPFALLARYMNRGLSQGEGKAVLWHNFYGSEQSNDSEIVATFESNARLLAERKNGNVLYHEILSFSAGHLMQGDDLAKSVADIGQQYLHLRAPEQIAYGVVHLDTDHAHLHLMISANPAGKSTRVRLSKHEFAQAQKSLEQFVLSHYPELAQTAIYDQQRVQERIKLRAHEQAMRARTHEPSHKETIKNIVEQALLQANSLDELKQQCSKHGITFYQRGKALGVTQNDPNGRERKHRLATLGLQEQFQTFQARDQARQLQTASPASPTRAPQREQALRLAHRQARTRQEQDGGTFPESEPTPTLPLPPPAKHGILLPGDDLLFQYLNMNTHQAKELPLPNFLHQLGYVPVRRR